MSKIMLVGDSHWGISSCNQQMIKQNINVWNYILDMAKEYSCEAIIETGDFLDKRKEIDANLLDIIKYNLIEKLDKYQIKLYMNVGNHNLYYRDSSAVNNISIFQSLSNNIKVIESPTKLYNIDIIPWINKENIDTIKDYIVNSNSKYCVGHFEFNGFNFDKSRVAEVEEKLTRSTFNFYKKVFSGHYHIRSEKDNVLYVGTPHQLTWIDVDVEKYIYILDTDTDDLIELVMPFEMFKQFEIDENNWQEYCNDDLKDKKVKILYEDNIDAKFFNDIQTKFTQINPDIQFIKKSSKKKLQDKVTLDESKSLLDSIIDYVDNIKPENQDKIKSLIKKVYNG